MVHIELTDTGMPLLHAYLAFRVYGLGFTTSTLITFVLQVATAHTQLMLDLDGPQLPRKHVSTVAPIYQHSW